MILRRIIAACALLWALSVCAFAQTGSIKTPGALNTEINATYPDNNQEQITPFGLRQVSLDQVASVPFLNSTNAFTGANSFAGTVNFTGTFQLNGSPLGTGVAAALIKQTNTSGGPATWPLTTAGLPPVNSALSIGTITNSLNCPTVSCLYASGPYVYAADYMACDNATNDNINLRNATLAAAGKVLVFPSGSKTCLVNAWNLCAASTCQNTAAGGAVPIAILGNGVTLKGTASSSGSALVYVENPPMGFRLSDLNINANSDALIGFEVFGAQYMRVDNLIEWGATGDGCKFIGTLNFGHYYNSYHITCGYNINGSSSSNGGNGIDEYTFSSGSPGCLSSTSYNNDNSFFESHSAWNAGKGWDINCAGNSHFSPESEDNLGVGFVFTALTAAAVSSDFFGGHSESNNNVRGTSGTDTTANNTDSSHGIHFYGGGHAGVFTAVTGANHDIVEVEGASGFSTTATATCSAGTCKIISIP